jgi:hypothetical protein
MNIVSIYLLSLALGFLVAIWIAHRLAVPVIRRHLATSVVPANTERFQEFLDKLKAENPDLTKGDVAVALCEGRADVVSPPERETRPPSPETAAALALPGEADEDQAWNEATRAWERQLENARAEGFQTLAERDQARQEQEDMLRDGRL